MLYGLYLSAAGAIAEDAKSAVVANNLANVNTVGFKADLAVVRARQAEAEEKSLPAFATPLDAIGGGAIIAETRTRFGQGSITLTNGPLDLAIEGQGFFPVTDGSSQYYTRAGAFTRDPSGRLLTADGGAHLADANGRPITVPAEGTVSVTPDGTISVDGAQVGKIDLVGFSQPEALAKIGASLYVNRGSATYADGAGQIKQGALEASTVSATAGLAKMIAAMRGYEANMQLLRMQDQMLGELVAIGKIS